MTRSSEHSSRHITHPLTAGWRDDHNHRGLGSQDAMSESLEGTDHDGTGSVKKPSTGTANMFSSTVMSSLHAKHVTSKLSSLLSSLTTELTVDTGTSGGLNKLVAMINKVPSDPLCLPVQLDIWTPHGTFQ